MHTCYKWQRAVFLVPHASAGNCVGRKRSSRYFESFAAGFLKKQHHSRTTALATAYASKASPAEIRRQIGTRFSLPENQWSLDICSLFSLFSLFGFLRNACWNLQRWGERCESCRHKTGPGLDVHCTGGL